MNEIRQNLGAMHSNKKSSRLFSNRPCAISPRSIYRPDWKTALEAETGCKSFWVWTNIPAGPISFSYALRAPSGDTGAKSISASVIYRADGQLLVPVAGADPLVLPQATYHTADYRAPFWQMDGTEVNRVLSYWRAGGYHRDAGGSDGFAPGPGATDGPRHAADFREALWVIDGTEVNRVLSYWRAGGYHPDTNGVDGFAPGVP